MSENVIFCYSSTGNCLDMAKNIARVLGDTDIIMMRKRPSVTDVRHAKRVGFVFPCYAGGLPGNVEKYLKWIRISPKAYTFGVCQYSGYMGAGLHMLDQIIRLDYWKAVSHQCAYIPLLPHRVMLPFMSPKKAQRRSERLAVDIADDIKLEKRSKKRPPRKLLNALEHKLWPSIVKRQTKRFKVYRHCTGCGLCASLCPTGNIQLVNGKPVWGKRCYQCVSCLQYCPKQAISLGNVTDRREHYHNPCIRPSELVENQIHING